MPLNKKPHKRPRFYADENIFPESVSFLRSKKVNILHVVSDLEFGGKNDTFHWKWANKYQRVLLTLDRDFLNNPPVSAATNLGNDCDYYPAAGNQFRG